MPEAACRAACWTQKRKLPANDGRDHESLKPTLLPFHSARQSSGVSLCDGHMSASDFRRAAIRADAVSAHSRAPDLQLHCNGPGMKLEELSSKAVCCVRSLVLYLVSPCPASEVRKVEDMGFLGATATLHLVARQNGGDRGLWRYGASSTNPPAGRKALTSRE